MVCNLNIEDCIRETSISFVYNISAVRARGDAAGGLPQAEGQQLVESIPIQISQSRSSFKPFKPYSNDIIPEASDFSRITDNSIITIGVQNNPYSPEGGYFAGPRSQLRGPACYASSLYRSNYFFLSSDLSSD